MYHFSQGSFSRGKFHYCNDYEMVCLLILDYIKLMNHIMHAKVTYPSSLTDQDIKFFWTPILIVLLKSQMACIQPGVDAVKDGTEIEFK